MPLKNNETYSDYKKRVIDIKSESWCAAKSYNATIWLGSGQTTSCHHPPAHSIDLEELKKNPKALHNTKQKKLERAMMQRGEKPSGCDYCWKIESMNTDAISDRVYKTVIYSDEDLDYAFNLDPQQDVNLRTLEIAFDRTCQFACSYCNPAFSSTWVRDIRQHGPYTNLVSDGRNHFTHAHDGSQLYTINDRNPYVDAFFQWWESDLHQTLDELRITGGEPLMSGYTWKLIDWFRDNPGRSHTRLAINSNLGMEWHTVQRLLDGCQGIDLDIYTSNESMDGHAEYIRDGLEFRQWYSNVIELIESQQLRGLHVMCTINALCLESLPEFLELMVGLKKFYGSNYPNFTLNILRFPSFQSPLVLPDNIREQHRQRLIAWMVKHKGHNYLHEHEVNHVARLIDYLDVVKTPHSDAFDLPKLHNDFRQFYDQYDRRRGKNFQATFPNLSEWYGSLSV